jgi:metal-responsive CopG/Arc/MetJ family transcriptional regulator
MPEARGRIPLLYEIVVFCHNTCMSPSPSRTSRVFTISFPEELAKQVVAIADEESRNISELFREAFRTYRRDRIQRKLEAARAEAATRGPVRYTEDDVESIVDEIRAEQYARRKKTA